MNDEGKGEPIHSKAINIWESPPQMAVRGVVQPRVIPPLHKPTRRTNQLDFLMKNVLKSLLHHQDAWPFISPVDTVRLNIPDYHELVKRPMDLSTIMKRLENGYYFSADECMHDFETIFANCYKYNSDENDDVRLMCKNVEEEYRLRIKHLPTPEMEMTRSVAKRRFAEDAAAGKYPRRCAALSHRLGDVSSECSHPARVRERHLSNSTNSSDQKEPSSYASNSNTPPNHLLSHSESDSSPRTSSLSTSRQTNLIESEVVSDAKTDQRKQIESVVLLKPHDASVALMEDKQMDSLQRTIEEQIINIQQKILQLQRYQEDISILQGKRKEARRLQEPEPVLPRWKFDMIGSILSSAPVLCSDTSPSNNTSPPSQQIITTISTPPNQPIIHQQFSVPSNTNQRRFQSIDQTEHIHKNLIKIVSHKRCDVQHSAASSDERNVSSTTAKNDPNSEQGTASESNNTDSAEGDRIEKRASVCCMHEHCSQTGESSENVTSEMNASERVHSAVNMNGSLSRPSKKRGRQPNLNAKYTKRFTASVQFHNKPQLNLEDDREIVPMNHEDKRRLSLDINRLPQDRLSSVVSIIRSYEGLAECDDDELEFDIETLKPLTLRVLEDFVASCLKKKPRKPYTPKSQEDVDRRKHELLEKIKGLGGTVSAEYPRRAPQTNNHSDMNCTTTLSESSSNEDTTSDLCSSSSSSATIKHKRSSVITSSSNDSIL